MRLKVVFQSEQKVVEYTLIKLNDNIKLTDCTLIKLNVKTL